jgi:7,8-dihydropterin-6-yl-methyl-4-(beta-D-ribofuranosyl)aminobenzene 5'-phosphate synthase
MRSVNLRVIVEDSTSIEKPDLLAKHGLSILVEVELEDSCRLKLMVDTGPSDDLVLRNMKSMAICPKEIDLIMLSHGHYDHTGGLLGILRKVGRQIPVILHPKALSPKLKLKPFMKYIGWPGRLSDIERAGGVVLLNRSPVALADDISTSGEIDRVTTFEDVEGFWTIDNGALTRDNMVDDQALFIKFKNKGLGVVTGCAHAGVINTIRHAQKIMKTEKVYAVIGGFHLSQVNNERIEATIRELTNLGPEIVCPCHCTGLNAARKLIEAFGDRCMPLRTGDVLRLS